MRKKIFLIISALILVLSMTVVTGCGPGELTEEQQAQVTALVQQNKAILKGDPGPMGPAGTAGVKGATGATGPAGADGAEGKSFVGSKGSVGPAGPEGPAGPVGPAGPKGNDGVGGSGGQGATGATGATGPQGPAGSVTTPLFTAALEVKNLGLSLTSSTEVNTGTYSVHLTVPDNSYGFADSDEARLVLYPVKPITLGQINSIGWQEFLNTGSPPHVDIRVMTATGTQETIVVQYAYNGAAHYSGVAPYGAETGAWYAVFNDDGDGPSVVDDTAFGWLSSGAAGPYPVTAVLPATLPVGGVFVGGSLADWKAGNVITGISGDSQIINMTIEIDNWGPYPVDAYLDAVQVNGISVWE